MNKEYIYYKGQAIVIDEKDNRRVVDYFDNLNQVLVQENLIKEMEKKIEELKDEISGFKELSNWKKALTLSFPLLITTTILDAFIAFALYTDGFLLIEEIDRTIASMALMCTTLGITMSQVSYTTLENNQNDKKAKRYQLEQLEKQLEISKKKIEKLKENKTSVNEFEDKSLNKVDCIKELKELKSFLLFNYDFSYNEEKYYRYYRKGTLDKKLQNKVLGNEEYVYDENSIEIIKKRFDQKEKTLQKKINTNQ